MIAQLVFDLPIEGPFDYLVPEGFVGIIKIGQRVKVSFGTRRAVGFVVALLSESSIAKLKPIDAVLDQEIVFNELDLEFARDFSAYYGCSLGEALTSLLRNKKELKPSLRREHQPEFSLYRCVPQDYAHKILKVIEGYQRPYKDAGAGYCRFLVLVPDSFRAQMLSGELKTAGVQIGTRSAVFDSDGRFDCVFMVDAEDASFRQEQTPMYHTTQVLLRRSAIFGFDVVFVGVSPSIELMAMVDEGKIKLVQNDKPTAVKLVDLTNYKFVPGMVSPPVRDAFEAALKAGKKGFLVLNRRGSYCMTRCVDCGEVLKCQHCDSPLNFSRSAKKYTCRHCTFTLPGDTHCPKCHKPSWRSQGFGVEQLQTELKKIFPQAKILAFEREAKSTANNRKPIGNFDILISTQALLRFQGQLKVQVAAFIDFDAELTRLDMRSGFNAMSLALHVASMAEESFIQSRNSNHYVLQSLGRANLKDFYDEELKLRKEFGFSPFKHWIKIGFRGGTEKSVKEVAQDVYNKLEVQLPQSMTATEPMADGIMRKRDQFRFNVMVHAHEVVKAMAAVKSVLAASKRPSRVIITFMVDP